jgi:hypothetical protein
VLVVSSEEVSRRVLEAQSSDLKDLIMALTGTQEAETGSFSRERRKTSQFVIQDPPECNTQGVWGCVPLTLHAQHPVLLSTNIGGAEGTHCGYVVGLQ